jgi:hypothetical protein
MPEPRQAGNQEMVRYGKGQIYRREINHQQSSV